MRRRRQHLKRHLRCHSKEQPWACSRCGRRFSRQDSAVRHGKTHANETLPLLPGAKLGSVCSLVSDLLAAGAVLPAPNEGGTSGSPSTSAPPIAVTPTSLPAPLTDQSTPVLTDADGLHMLADSAYAQQAFGVGDWAEPPLDPSLFNADNGIVGAPLTDEWSDLFQLLVDGTACAGPNMLDWPEPQVEPVASTSTLPPAPSTAADEADGTIHALHQTRNVFIRLSSSLEPAWGISTDLLSAGLSLFFLRVNPLVPIIHRPTFNQRNLPPGALLNLVVLGTLFLGTDSARQQGEYLWSVGSSGRLRR